MSDITISKHDLLTKLQVVIKMISNKSSLPITTNFLFKTDGDGILHVTGSNIEGRITAKVACKAGNMFSVCVPTNIVEALKALPEQPIEISYDHDFMIVLSYNGGTFKIQGYDPEIYPATETENFEGSLSFLPSTLCRGIDKVICMADEGDLRPVLNSTCIESRGGKVSFVATNAHALGYIEINGIEGPDSTFILRKQIASVIKSMIFMSEEEVTLRSGKKWSELNAGEYDIMFRNTEGRFPNWRSVIPKDNEIIMETNTKELVGAIKRTSVFSDRTLLVMLDINESKVRLSTQDVSYSASAEEELGCKCNGCIKVGVKASDILEILQSIESDSVVVKLKDPSKSILCVLTKTVMMRS